VASLLAGLKVKRGVIEYDYSAFLREKLYNPKMFALLNMGILNQFRSKYSLAIYNLCKDYLGAGQTPSIELEKFREFVGLEKHEYADFKSMNRRVIKEPVTEVNKISDIVVEVEYIKERRRVIGLKFFISPNPQLKFDIESLADQVMNNHAAGPDASDAEPDAGAKEPLHARLLGFGLTEKQARQTVEKYDAAYIRANLDFVEKECRLGKVNNVTAYTVAALREDYRPRKTFLDEENKTKNPARKKPAKTERTRALGEAVEELEIGILTQTLDNLTDNARRQLEKEFIDGGAEGKDFVMQYYRANGFDNIVVRGAFYAFAKHKLSPGGPTKDQLTDHLARKGFNPDHFHDDIREFFSAAG